MVQLTVYATMQVPSGLLLDRFGSRAMIAGGALLMAAGQGVLAVSDALAWAYLARVMIGAGDAATFIAVIRLVALWFPARRVPVLTQLSGVLGQTGQVVSALPLVALLHARGWTTAFGGLAAVGVMAAALCAAGRPRLADRQGGARSVGGPARPGSRGGSRARYLAGVLEPRGLAVPPQRVPAGLGLPVPARRGVVRTDRRRRHDGGRGGQRRVRAGHRRAHRSPPVEAVVDRADHRRCAVAAMWVAVLVHPGPAPVWMLALLAAVLGVGGPSSLVGFDFARSFNAPVRLGTATGLVNGGGFVFAVLAIFVVGVTLDAHPGTPMSLEAFRAAFAVQGVLWLVAVLGVLAARRRTRRLMAERGVVVPPVRAVLARRRDGRALEGLGSDADAEPARVTRPRRTASDPGVGGCGRGRVSVVAVTAHV